MTSACPYYRFALFAEATGQGEPSLAARLKERLEALGHTVFWFDPQLQPFVFARKGVVRGYTVRRFFRVQRLDGVLLADGLTFDFPETAREAAGAPVGLVCEDSDRVIRLFEGLAADGNPWAPDFALAAGDKARAALEEAGFAGCVCAWDPDADEAANPDDSAVPAAPAGPEAPANPPVGSLRAALGALHAALGLRGSSSPRHIACVFGYLGTANFANEHILTTIDARLRARLEGLSVVALSLHPAETLEHRGVYALSTGDKYVLDAALAHVSAVLVVAGLLNDGTVRAGIGKAEMLCNAGGCSLPAIAALAVLCQLNEAQLVFYGGGVGPLALADARKLVQLAGKLDALFLARDEQAATALSEAGVGEGCVFLGADPAFLGTASPTGFVDEWLAERGIDPAADFVLAVTLRAGEGFPPDFPQRVAGVLATALAKRPRLRVLLCALDSGDIALLNKVKAQVANPDRVNVFAAPTCPEAVADVLSRAHAGFSMQYYGTLALARAGVPCMGVAWQEKESALFPELGCEELSLCAHATEAEMGRALAALLDGRDERASRVAEGARKLAARALAAEDRVVAAVRERGAGKAFKVERDACVQRRPASERAHERRVQKLEASLEQARAEGERVWRVMASREYRLGSSLLGVSRKLGIAREEEAAESAE